MSSLALPRTSPRPRRAAGDLSPAVRILLAAGAGTVTLPILCALARAATGAAPHGAALKELALAIHLAAVVPALPLGAWLFLRRKGTANHRLLGKVWLVLMIVGAASAFWIRHLNGGGLSYIHLLVPVVLVTAYRAYAKARAGDILGHKRVLQGLFVGGLIVPGLLSFAPGRLMATWLLG